MGNFVSEILINQFLKDVDSLGKMPWQCPYKNYSDAFNWVTVTPYSGFNRLMLPFGEYMTANQLNKYNKDNGEDFKFQKGIKWFHVTFYTTKEQDVSEKDVKSALENVDLTKDGCLGKAYGWIYYHEGAKYIKRKNVLRYYRVADIKHFVNSKGEHLRSRLEDEVVTLSNSDAKQIISNYVNREGITIQKIGSTPCYDIKQDIIGLNPYYSNEDEWYSTAFHEMAHSTGAVNRLNRLSVESYEGDLIAQEECIAEITAYLLCCECGIQDFKTSGQSGYYNNIAYVQYWKKKVKDWGSTFLYICSKAEEAFNYIMGYREE